MGATVVIALLTVVGCSGGNHSDSKKPAPAPATAASLVGDLPRGDLLDTSAVLDPAIAKRTIRVLAAGSVTDTAGTRSGNEVATRTPEQTPAMLTAMDSENRVTARAITVAVPGQAQLPVPVDYVSTAFTRLATTPPFPTSDALELMVLRGLAEQSPHLDGLAQQIEATAKVHPDFEAHSSQAELTQFSTLVRDVYNALNNAAATQAGSNRVSPAWATAPSSARAGRTSAKTEAQCAPVADERLREGSTYTKGSDEVVDAIRNGDYDPTARVCVTLASKPKAAITKSGKQSYEVAITNSSPSWAVLKVERGANLALVPPRTKSLPKLADLAAAAAKAIVRMQASQATKLACKGLSFFGGKCPKKVKDWGDQKEIWEGFLDDINPVSDGEATIRLTGAELTSSLRVITAGAQRGSSGAAALGADPDPPPGIALTAATIANATTHLLLPLMDLTAGIKSDDGPAPKLGTKESATSYLEAVGEVANSNESLEKALDIYAAAVADRSLKKTLSACAALLVEIFTDLDSLKPVLASLGANLSGTDLVKSLVKKFATSPIPGVGWLKILDTAVGAVNLGLGSWALFVDLTKTVDRAVFSSLVAIPTPEAAPDTDEKALRAIDWKNFDGYVDVFAPYPSMTAPVLGAMRLQNGGNEMFDGTGSSPLVELVSGKPAYSHVNGVASALTVVLLRQPAVGDYDDGRDFDYTSSVGLYQMRAGKPTLVAYSQDPLNNFWLYSWRIENGQMVRYDSSLRVIGSQPVQPLTRQPISLSGTLRSTADLNVAPDAKQLSLGPPADLGNVEHPLSDGVSLETGDLSG